MNHSNLRSTLDAMNFQNWEVSSLSPTRIARYFNWNTMHFDKNFFFAIFTFIVSRLSSYSTRGLDRAMFLYIFIRKTRLKSVRDSITFVHIQKFYKICKRYCSIQASSTKRILTIHGYNAALFLMNLLINETNSLASNEILLRICLNSRVQFFNCSCSAAQIELLKLMTLFGRFMNISLVLLGRFSKKFQLREHLKRI